jgi:hypothetical protein
MRERILKSNAFKVIVWGLILVLGGVFTIPSLLENPSAGNWVARVNGVAIGDRELERRTSFWREQLSAFKKQYGKYADMFLQSMGLSGDPSVLAVDSIIKDELMNQEANKLHLFLNDAYVAEKLADRTFVQQVLSDLVPAYTLDPMKGINESLLHAYLRQINLSVADFEKKVSEALQRYFLIELMTGSVYVPAFEVKERFIADNVDRKYSILSFKFADYLKHEKGKEISAAELERFFEHQTKTLKRYWVPEKRVGATWKFSPTDYDIVVTEQEVADYYDMHKTSKYIERPSQVEVRVIVFAVKDKADEEKIREKAQAVHKELRENPESFASKAKEVSDDAETAQKGGLMPAFSKGVHEQAFERAAFLLKNDGDISVVLRTKRGFEIVQRVRKQPVMYKSLESAKRDIQAILLKQKFSQKFVKDIEKLIQNPDTIDSFIVSKKAKMETNPAREKDGSKLAAELFELKENEYGVYVDGDAGILVKLIGIQKKYLPTLDSIKELVENDFHEERADQAIKHDLDAAREQASKKSFKELQSLFKAHLEETPFVSKGDTKSLKSLKDQGFPIDSLFQIEKTGMVARSVSDRNGYLAQIKELAPIDESSMTAQFLRVLKGLKRELSEVWGQGFVASLYRNATINLNENRFKQQ